MRTLIGIVVLLFIGLIACNRSEEQTAFQKSLQDLEDHREENLSQLKEKYNPILFPGEDLSGDSLTIEFQQFFRKASENHILFNGYLNDIEETTDGLLVTYICPLYTTLGVEETKFLLKDESVVIAFRLKATIDQITKSLTERKVRDPFFVDWLGPTSDCHVIARIDTINKIRHYEAQGKGAGIDDVEVSIEVFPSYVAEGQLIDFFIE